MRTLGAFFLLSLAMFGQTAQIEEKTTERHSFNSPKSVLVDTVYGAIDVVGYSGSELQVEVTKTVQADTAERVEAAKRDVKLEVKQEGGDVRLYVDGPSRCNCGDGYSYNARHQSDYRVVYDFKLKVPQGVRMELRTVSKGMVTVANTVGDFVVSDVNAGIEMTNVSGSGKVSTVNGPVKVTFARNPPGACSFHTVNGDLDISFQPGLSADLRMKTLNGGLYTDYEVSALPAEAIQPSERRNGKFVYRADRSTGVRIGHGGQALDFQTLNGSVYVRNRDKK